MRLWMLFVAALVCAPRIVLGQKADQRKVTVEWRTAVGGDRGYEYAAIDVIYRFMTCEDEVHMTYALVPGSLQVGEWYRFNGKRHLVNDIPRPHVSSIDFGGAFLSNGRHIGSFRDSATGSGGPVGCYGRSKKVGTIKELIGDKPSYDDVQRFLDGLSVSVNRMPHTLTNGAVESSLRQKEREEKEKADKAERDRIAKENADKAAAEQAEQDRIAKEQEEKDKAERERLANENKANDPANANEAENNNASDNTTGSDANQSATSNSNAGSEGAKTGNAQSQPKPADTQPADSKPAEPEKPKERLGKETEWTEADEVDTGYWPEERCSFWDEDGFISPPRGRHRCDPDFIKWVLEERHKQRKQYYEQLRAEEEQKAQQQQVNYRQSDRQGLGAIGAGGAALAGAAGSSAGGSSEYDEFEGGPGLLEPVLVFIEGGLVGAGVYVGVSKGLGPSLDRRLGAMAKAKLAATQYRCERDKGGACGEHALWTRAADPVKRRKLAWDAASLLGPGIGFGFGIGYVREHRGGPADSTSPAMFDGTLSGLALDATWRIRFVRAQVGFNHLRGDLLANRTDDLRYTESQGLNAMTLGLGLQLGWTQLISPYVGFRHRIDFQSGDFADEFDGENQIRHQRIRNLNGGRELATLGATLQFPPSFDDTMFRSWMLNVELYHSVDASEISSGVMVTFGRFAWAPGWLTGLDGLSTSNHVDDGHDTWFLPYAFARGAGIKLLSFDRKRISFSAFDFWLDANRDGQGFGNAGFTLVQVGPRFRLPGFDHSLSLTLGPGLNVWEGDEIITIQSPPDPSTGMSTSRMEHVRTFGIGTATAAYRAFVKNHAIEVGLKMPLLSWENRATNSLDFEGASYFAGLPRFLYIGLGY